MIINGATLAALSKTVNVLFMEGLAGGLGIHTKIAMQATSTTAQNDYKWLGKFPRMRKWVGDRVVKALSAHGFTIENEPFESTIGIHRDDIEDDNIGIYSPIIQEMASAARDHPDEMLADLILQGHTSPCYDGQYFFDTDHPVQIGDDVTTFSNYGGGAGALWVLLCTDRPIKPFIEQTRRKPQLVSQDDPKNNEAAFMRAEYLYGVDYRGAVGYGLWQLAYASRQALTEDNYEAARGAMMSLKNESGKPLNIVPDTLLVAPTLESEARELLLNERTSTGGTNTWKGTAEPVIWPLLAE